MACAAVGDFDGDGVPGGNDCGSSERGAVRVLLYADVTVKTGQEIPSTSGDLMGSLVNVSIASA